MKKKKKLLVLSFLFIFISVISVTIGISTLWWVFSTNRSKKYIEVFNKSVHLKRELYLEKTLVENTLQLIKNAKIETIQNLEKIINDKISVIANILPMVSSNKKYLNTIKKLIYTTGLTSLKGVSFVAKGKNILFTIPSGKEKQIQKYIKLIQNHLNSLMNHSTSATFFQFNSEKFIFTVKRINTNDIYLGYILFKKEITPLIKAKIISRLRTHNITNPILFILQESKTDKKCNLKVIFFSEKHPTTNPLCLSKFSKRITYLNKQPCLKTCLKKLSATQNLTVKIISPFFNPPKNKRIVYLHYYKPLNWIIGASAPENFLEAFPSFNKMFQREIGHQIHYLLLVSITSGSVISFLIWLALYIILIYKPIRKDLNVISNFFKEFNNKKPFIETDKIKIQEIETIAKEINNLFRSLGEKNSQINDLLNQFKRLAENMPNCLGIFTKDKNGDFILTFANSKMSECGFFKEKLTGKRLEEIFPAIKNEKSILYILDKSNNIIELSTICPYTNKFVTVSLYQLKRDSIVCIIRDITESVLQFREREKSRKTLQAFLDKIKSGVIVLNGKGEIKYINAFAKHLLGLEKDDCFNISDINIPDKIKYKFLKVIHKRETCENCEINITTLDGRSRWFEITASATEIGKETVVIISFNDVTQKHIKNKELEYLSFHDTLTGLYNRRYFEEELKRLFNKRNYPITLLILDLNGLKIANDILGHNIGDKLIVKIAEILSTSTRGNDIVARIGGDEFAVLMPNTDENGALKLIDRINAKIDEVNKNHRELRISVSYGFAVQYGNFETPDDLFKEADKNMYTNKYSSNRKSELKEIIKWALEVKKDSLKQQKPLKIDEDYLLGR